MIKRNILRKYYALKTRLIYKLLFSHIGSHSNIYHPMQIDNMKSIYLGNNVHIADYCWLMGGGGDEPSLIIDDNTTIGHFAHIVGIKKVHIEENVLIADRVFISDCTHKYKNAMIPILNQGIEIVNDVLIGRESWIGENVCICGASIGKHCIIGANSVVTKNIPDYCVALGAPAKIIKRYDPDNREWKNMMED